MTVGRTEPDPMARILDLAQAVLDDPGAGPQQLAARAHLSRFHFDRVVAATAGEPPGALRRRVLLERAAHRLSTSDTPVVDVALEAGFGSHEAFTRAFGRAYGRPPTAVRADPPPTFHDLELAAPSGVHFHPPGGLRLPATRQETGMDVLETLLAHHVESLTELIGLAAGLPDGVLDAPIELSVEAVDDDMSLRTLLGTMVWQEEHWLAALRGGGRPVDGDLGTADLAGRHAVAGRDLLEVVRSVVGGARLAETVVDTTCSPPQTFTLGGILGHVVTFAAVRRTLAVGALWSAGVPRMDLADPRARLDAAGSAP